MRCINLRAIKLVKLVKLTGALLKSIQPVIGRWLFVKAMFTIRLLYDHRIMKFADVLYMNPGGVTDMIGIDIYKAM